MLRLKNILSLAVSGLVSVWLVIGLAACRPAEPSMDGSQPQKTASAPTATSTAPKFQITPTPTVFPVPLPEDESCCDIFRIGLYGEPAILNYWYLYGPGHSIWGQYVLEDWAGRLFTISEKNFQFVPALARDIPEPVENADATWTVRVDLLPGLKWSDGQALTAQDVVFTHNTCKTLQLTHYWPLYCSPGGAEISIRAIDETTLAYTFHDGPPSLRTWQFGIAMMPILPEHFWADTVNEAVQIVQDISQPEVRLPDNCESNLAGQPEKEACSAWETYLQAFENAQNTLYRADGRLQPVAGPYRFADWVPHQKISLLPNENYYLRGATIAAYADGTWRRQLPSGETVQLYGSGDGEKTLELMYGPFNPEVVYQFYDSQLTAFRALEFGEVEFVLNTEPLLKSLTNRLSKNKTLTVYANPAYDLFYLGFNLRKSPLSAIEFRQAFAVLIDRDEVIAQSLTGQARPLSGVVPVENSFWHSPLLQPDQSDLSRPERLELAVEILAEAGWYWRNAPYWDSEAQKLVPGEGLFMPDGQPMPELSILGPTSALDFASAAFVAYLAEWAAVLGMPVQPTLTELDVLYDAVFITGDYDLYVYGWPSLGDPAFPVYLGDLWYSRNCTFESGKNNTTCYQNDRYDALAAAFYQTGDMEQAQELAADMQQILAKDLPYIPLYSRVAVDIANTRVRFPQTEILGGITFYNGFLATTKVQNK